MTKPFPGLPNLGYNVRMNDRMAPSPGKLLAQCAFCGGWAVLVDWLAGDRAFPANSVGIFFSSGFVCLLVVVTMILLTRYTRRWDRHYLSAMRTLGRYWGRRVHRP